jgi:hypothetical protein
MLTLINDSNQSLHSSIPFVHSFLSQIFFRELMYKTLSSLSWRWSELLCPHWGGVRPPLLLHWKRTLVTSSWWHLVAAHDGIYRFKIGFISIYVGVTPAQTVLRHGLCLWSPLETPWEGEKNLALGTSPDKNPLEWLKLFAKAHTRCFDQSDSHFWKSSNPTHLHPSSLFLEQALII